MEPPNRVGVVLERMVHYSSIHPTWERSAALLFLLGVFFGCTSIFNRLLFSFGLDTTESLFLLEVLFPTILILLSILLGLDRLAGYPINLGRFANRELFVLVFPCALMFALRNTVPAYALALSKESNIRDFVFCTRLVQPITVFVLENIVTSRHLWRWHLVSFFVMLSGISVFLFNTFESSVNETTVPLLGRKSNAFATMINFLAVACGAGFFVLFARLATRMEGDKPQIPVQDLIAFHFIAALCMQVILSVITGTLADEISVIFNNKSIDTQRLMVSAVLNMVVLTLRMICLAKTSCMLTMLVPLYFIIPIRILMGAPYSAASLVGAVLATIGGVGFLVATFTEFSSFSTPTHSWVTSVLNLAPQQINTKITNAVACIFGVSLFSLLFPIVCKYLFRLSTSYVVWSILIFVLPLALFNHFLVFTKKSVSGLYLCSGLVIFAFMTLQFGPISGISAFLAFLVELFVVFTIGGGLDALQLYNGFRPGVVVEVEERMEAEERRHDEEVAAVAGKFILGDHDDDDL